MIELYCWWMCIVSWFNIFIEQNTPEKELIQPKIIHQWFARDDFKQDLIEYAYDLGWIDFVTMIECENGQRNPESISKTDDHWLCQLHYSYNKEFIDSEEFKDPYTQLDYCYEKWKINPNLWYWPKRKIKGQKCSDYVLNRFIISKWQ